jgi:hypothetical protein
MSLREFHKIKDIIYDEMIEYCNVDGSNSGIFIQASKESAIKIEKLFCLRGTKTGQIKRYPDRKCCVCGKATSYELIIKGEKKWLCVDCERDVVKWSLDEHYQF